MNKQRYITKSESLTGKQYHTYCCCCCKCEKHFPEVKNYYLPKYPFITDCPNCHMAQDTRIRRVNTKKVHIFALVLAPLGLCLLPYCIPTCKKVRHYCATCGIYLGTCSGPFASIKKKEKDVGKNRIV